MIRPQSDICLATDRRLAFALALFGFRLYYYCVLCMLLDMLLE
jgi:hypothetical protein